MTATAAHRDRRGEGAKSRAGRDGEIKGPGPFGSMTLMMLENFRDLKSWPGPGFYDFSSNNNGLSGTSRWGRGHG